MSLISVIQLFFGLYTAFPVIAIVFGVILYFYRPMERLGVGVVLIVLGVFALLVNLPVSFILLIDLNSFNLFINGLVVADCLMVFVGVLSLRNRSKDKPKS